MQLDHIFDSLTDSFLYHSILLACIHSEHLLPRCNSSSRIRHVLRAHDSVGQQALPICGGNERWKQEIMKVREVIPHTGPIPIVIPLRLFLDDINFPADNVTARVTWKFRGGGKVQQILYDATLRFQN